MSPKAAGQTAEPQKSVCEEAHQIINGDRRADYGDVQESFDQIAKLWSVCLGHKVTARDVAVCLMQLKISRLLHGWQRDSLVDICGYAGCAEQLS